MYLYPKTIKRGTALGKVDITVRRPSLEEKPKEAHILFIENGQAHYATSVSPQSSLGRWKTDFTLGPASDVAIEFDLQWMETYGNKYRPITLGEPWLFRVTDGKLLAQKGFTTMPLELDTGGITQVSSVRGWQNVLVPADDHGLVVLYVKQGVPHYVNYSMRADGYREWSLPQVIPGFSSVTAIRGIRTNDYRVVVLIEDNGSIYRIASTRNWAGLGASVDYLRSEIETLSIKLTELTSRDVEVTAETVKADIMTELALNYALTDNEIMYGYNIGDNAIQIGILHKLPMNDVNYFKVVDSKGRSFKVTDVAGSNALTINVERFNNAIGDITVTIENALNITGNVFDTVSYVFTPEGLEPDDIPIPKVIRITNEEG